MKAESLPRWQAHGPSMQIPEFQVGDEISVGTRNMKEVNCTRCDSYFYMPVSWFEESRSQTRPCPHCFKVSVVPPHPSIEEPAQ